MIRSPSVFHTAPPQPRSNARWICPPLLVGGALASQNGLGDLMPAISMLRSAINPPRRTDVGRCWRRGGFAMRDRVDDFLAAKNAIAAGKQLWVARLQRRLVDDNPSSLVSFQPQ